MSPFHIVYGRPPPGLTRYDKSEKDPPNIRELLTAKDEILVSLKVNLQKAQQRMSDQANKHRRDAEFQIGDWVLVKLQPYRQHSVALRKNSKLGLRYFGPFQVLQRIGAVAYRLKLPEESKIHHVFHISVLKSFKGYPAEQYIPMPLTFTDQGPLLHLAAILQKRQVKKGGKWVAEVLVQWEGLNTEEATWEDQQSIQELCASLNLEDKVVFKEGAM